MPFFGVLGLSVGLAGPRSADGQGRAKGRVYSVRAIPVSSGDSSILLTAEEDGDEV